MYHRLQILPVVGYFYYVLKVRMGRWRRFFSVSVAFTGFSSYCMSVRQNRPLLLGTWPFSSGSRCLFSIGVGFWAQGFLLFVQEQRVFTSTPISEAVDLCLDPRDEKVCSSFIQELKAFVSYERNVWATRRVSGLSLGRSWSFPACQHHQVSLSLFPVFLVSAQWSLWEITWNVPFISGTPSNLKLS